MFYFPYRDLLIELLVFPGNSLKLIGPLSMCIKKTKLSKRQNCSNIPIRARPTTRVMGLLRNRKKTEDKKVGIWTSNQKHEKRCFETGFKREFLKTPAV